MATAPPPEPVKSSPDRPPRPSRHRAILGVLVVAAVVVIAAAAWYVLNKASTPGPLAEVPAHVTAYLSNGTAILDVPLMAFYTAPAAQSRGFATNASFTMFCAQGGPSANFTFRWGDADLGDLPVRFVLSHAFGDPSTYLIEPGPSNGFVVFPVGNCPAPTISARTELGMVDVGEASVMREVWRMNYSVLQMASTVDQAQNAWIQVNYTLLPMANDFLDSMPAANVSRPAASDLSLPVFINIYNLSRGQTLGTLTEARSASHGLAPFRHSLPPLTIDAGAAGNITAVLTSESEWGPAQDLWLGWSTTAAGAGTLTATYSIDLRFGSLVVAFS